ncbi:phage tail assembly chaperone [Xanthobacter sediminis]
MREEEPDAAAIIPEPEAPEGVADEDWHGLYWRAWFALRFDRQYGAMGGESQISFRAIDNYARRYEFHGEDFELLRLGVHALDDVWLEHVAEQMKAKDKLS